MGSGSDDRPDASYVPSVRLTGACEAPGVDLNPVRVVGSPRLCGEGGSGVVSGIVGEGDSMSDEVFADVDDVEIARRQIPGLGPNLEGGTMRYRTIVADPPWEIGDFPPNFGYEAGKRTPYPMMTLDAIRELPVSDLAASEAHLYLWTTAGYLRDAYGVAEAWGFEPMYPLVWCKPPYGEGLGGKFVSNVEFVLFCRDRCGAKRIAERVAVACDQAGVGMAEINRRMGYAAMAMWWLGKAAGGKARVPTWEQWLRLKEFLPLGDDLDEEVWMVNEQRGDGLRCPTRWWQWPRRAHSEKPEAFLDVVESVSPAPRLEMFARRQRLGWDTWGDEALDHVSESWKVER